MHAGVRRTWLTACVDVGPSTPGFSRSNSSRFVQRKHTSQRVNASVIAVRRHVTGRDTHPQELDAMHLLPRRIVACVVGLLIALAWHFINSEVIGYLAISRAPYHWPLLSQIGLPVVVFLIVVLLSYWLLLKLLGITSRLAIWVALGVYIVTSAYAVLTA